MEFPGELGDVNGTGQVQVAPSVQGTLSRLRVYNRYLRTSEAIGNYHAEGQRAMNPWTFVFVADIQVGSPKSFRFAPAWKDNWETARKQIVELDPELLLVGGDLTRDGYVAEHRYELEAIKADFDALPFPYHLTPGNMDAGNKHTDVQGPNTKRDDVALNIDTADLFGHFLSYVVDPPTLVHPSDLGFHGECRDIAGKDITVVVHLDIFQIE